MTYIAIMGTGSMARALASSWTRAGHSVCIGTRTPDDERNSGLREHASVRAHEAAIREAQVVVLALPFPEIVRFASTHRELLEGKTVIDPSDPFDYQFDGALGSSELVADGLGRRSGLVAAFKDNFAEQLDVTSGDAPAVIDVRLVADDPEAIALVAGLVRDMGHHPVDCGPLHNSRLLDAAACLLTEARRRAGHSRTEPRADES
ncbi:NADPH-dependent F420 reductase [Leifsonia shinshuensis]|uniref:NADP oxidoreductase n=1 Tax=Leifsonia shinshuensis TaxID=150026 RepID=A0A7G6YAV6_9MICO|nr:NAD(P)-binding domain-containing protein [Leifsonia shinshuensis]QNE35621.1 NADP oxidoreductase [Leifsonia shinshuensis]